jgi:hypothetical protein
LNKANVTDFTFYPVIHHGDFIEDIVEPIPTDIEGDLMDILDGDDLSCDSHRSLEILLDHCQSSDSSSSSLHSGTSSTTSSKSTENNLTKSSPTSSASLLLEANRFKPFHEEKWYIRYQELLVFYDEHKHAAVPHTYPKNPQLARWVKRQRRQFKLLQDGNPSTINVERLDLLNQIGFIWDSHDVNWREKIDTLLDFRRVHGHSNVPSSNNKNKDKKLGTWVKCQRRQYKLYRDGKSSSMTPERIAELDRALFEWEIRALPPKKNNPLPSSSKPTKNILVEANISS